MALAITTVTNSIAELSVSGLVIKDIDEVPEAVDPRQPTLLPLPDFITGFELERDSYGGGSTAKMTVRYQLNYRLCYAPLGDGRTTVLEMQAGTVEMIGLILDAVLAVDTMTGNVDIQPSQVVGMGAVLDPSDNAFWGCDISFVVTEFVN